MFWVAWVRTHAGYLRPSIQLCNQTGANATTTRRQPIASEAFARTDQAYLYLSLSDTIMTALIFFLIVLLTLIVCVWQVANNDVDPSV